MDFISITIVNIIWILYSMSEGLREGFFEHYKNMNKRNCEFKTTRIFTTQRFLVLLATGGLLTYTLGWISIPFIIGQFFMFKYFHKIIFNQTIQKLENKKLCDIKEDVTPEVSEPIYNKEKDPMILLGITIQIFIYIFLM